MNTKFCFCHCITVALALGRLRLMWLSWSPSAVIEHLDLMAGIVGLLLIKTVWLVLAHTKLLCRTGLSRLVFVFLFPLRALCSHCCSFGSLSTSETWAPYFQHQVGFALAGWRVHPVMSSALLCASPVRTLTRGHLSAWHTLSKHSVSLRRWRGGLLFYKLNKKKKVKSFDS